MLRRHRAAFHEVVTQVDAGDRPSWLTPGYLRQSVFAAVEDDPATEVDQWLRLGELKRIHVRYLDLWTEAVAIARLPVAERPAKLAALHPKLKQLGAESSLRPSFAGLFEVEDGVQRLLQSDAELARTVTALAAERYRRAEGDWPELLEQLVPEQLTSVPLDPRDGKPVQLRRLEDGLLIVTTGPDDKEVSFRLWDVERRRRKQVEGPN
jgi:hypothetical protein